MKMDGWVYLGSAENGNIASVTVVSNVQILTWEGEENTFIGRKRNLGGL